MRSLVIALAAVPLLVAAPRPSAPPSPASPVGGSVLICVASGFLFGASILSGSALGAAGALLTAIENDCI